MSDHERVMRADKAIEALIARETKVTLRNKYIGIRKGFRRHAGLTPNQMKTFWKLRDIPHQVADFKIRDGYMHQLWDMEAFQIQNMLPYFNPTQHEQAQRILVGITKTSEEKQVTNTSAPPDITVFTVNVQSATTQLEVVVRKIQKGQWNLHPQYQRDSGIWTITQQSRLIESLIVGLPVPPIFLLVTPSGVREVVDGLQRLTTIKSYVTEDSFQLKNLDLQSNLNGKRFQDLPEHVRNKLFDAAITTFEVTPSPDSNAPEVYRNPRLLAGQVFDRLNAGTPTTAGERERAVSLGQIGTLTTALCEILCSQDGFSRSDDVTFSRDILHGFAAQRIAKVAPFMARIQEDTQIFGTLFKRKGLLRGHANIWVNSLPEDAFTTYKQQALDVATRLFQSFGEHALRASVDPTKAAYRKSHAAAFFQAYIVKKAIEHNKSDAVIRAVWRDFYQSPRYWGLSYDARGALNEGLDLIDTKIKDY